VEGSVRKRKKIPHEGSGGADLQAVLIFKNTWLDLSAWRGVEFRIETHLNSADTQESKQVNKQPNKQQTN